MHSFIFLSSETSLLSVPAVGWDQRLPQGSGLQSDQWIASCSKLRQEPGHRRGNGNSGIRFKLWPQFLLPPLYVNTYLTDKPYVFNITYTQIQHSLHGLPRSHPLTLHRKMINQEGLNQLTLQKGTLGAWSKFPACPIGEVGRNARQLWGTAPELCRAPGLEKLGVSAAGKFLPH